MIRRELPEQFDLGDVSVLEFVHQDVAIARAERRGYVEIAAQQMDGFEQLHTEREQVPIAQQPVAGSISPGDLPLFRYPLFAQPLFVLQKCVFLSRILVGQRFDIPLVIVRRNQFILAAREELHEVAQELPRFRQPPIAFQRQHRKISA